MQIHKTDIHTQTIRAIQQSAKASFELLLQLRQICIYPIHLLFKNIFPGVFSVYE